MECPNLRELAGERYRVRREMGQSRDPWNYFIPCSLGHICPWGPGLLAACTDRRRPIVLRKLLEIPGAMLEQDGEDGANVSFPDKHFKRVAAIMKARVRRMVTEQERQRLAGLGRRFGFNASARASISAPDAT